MNWVAEYAVPVAFNTGSNAGSGFCRLYGSYKSYSKEQLGALYSSNLDYLGKVMKANDDNIKAGFILKPGAAKTIAAAVLTDVTR